ncbi:hypothetical protein K530_55095 [Streptomyces noursei CCRC 11814]|nr:hypothetical protein K530_55095 [Streptomyces noursei CCRC 11814]
MGLQCGVLEFTRQRLGYLGRAFAQHAASAVLGRVIVDRASHCNLHDWQRTVSENTHGELPTGQVLFDETVLAALRQGCHEGRLILH